MNGPCWGNNLLPPSPPPHTLQVRGATAAAAGPARAGAVVLAGSRSLRCILHCLPSPPPPSTHVLQVRDAAATAGPAHAGAVVPAGSGSLRSHAADPATAAAATGGLARVPASAAALLGATVRVVRRGHLDLGEPSSLFYHYAFPVQVARLQRMLACRCGFLNNVPFLYELLSCRGSRLVGLWRIYIELSTTLQASERK
eukprot:scaffold27546_cov19-Tisochrysis_lutea.AAC.1